MFGYLIANTEILSEEQKERYKACYCGLCRSLKERHGQLSRLTLNFDMTFLVLLLGSLYEPEERRDEQRCMAHPMKPRAWWQTEMSDYAADMNLALAYHKCRDNWQDDTDPVSLAAAAALKSSYKKLEQQYPRQCAAIEKSIKELSMLEKSKTEDADAAAATFGELMAEILVWREDYWSGTLRSMGRALGRFIYIMDACMDLDQDATFNKYNPFRRRYGLENEQYFREILKMLLGECVYHFDRLPLVQDVGILQNILCVGLWTEFEKKYSSMKGPADVSGSV